MKFPGEAAERVARVLLHGPATAAELAEHLRLTPTAVRKSLTALLEAGLVEAHDRAPYGPQPKARRGRPAHVFSLTDAGRAACGSAYDELAIAALTFVARTQGDDGVRAFAAERARSIVTEAPAQAPDANPVAQVAERLTQAGYAAEVATSSGNVVQLCMHACPVSEAAAAFPAICEAETAVLSEVLGVHVTQLATIAHGDGVCTAVVPVPTAERRSS